MYPQVNWREPRNDRRLQMSMTARASLGAPQTESPKTHASKAK